MEDMVHEIWKHALVDLDKRKAKSWRKDKQDYSAMYIYMHHRDIHCIIILAISSKTCNEEISHIHFTNRER